MSFSFGENLKNIMKQKDVSVRQLSNRCKVSSKTISSWLSDRDRMPRSPQVLKALCDALGCTLEELLWGTRSSHAHVDLSAESLTVGTFEVTIKRKS